MNNKLVIIFIFLFVIRIDLEMKAESISDVNRLLGNFDKNVKKIKTLSFSFERNAAGEKHTGNINYDQKRCYRYEKTDMKNEEVLHSEEGYSSIPSGIQVKAGNFNNVVSIREIITEKNRYLEGIYEKAENGISNPLINSKLRYDETKYVPQEYISTFSLIFGEIQTEFSDNVVFSSVIGQFKDNFNSIRITKDNNSFVLETVSKTGDTFAAVFSNGYSIPTEIRYRKNPRDVRPMQIQSAVYSIKKCENIEGIDIPTHYTEEIKIEPGVVELYGQKVKTYGNQWKQEIYLKDISVNNELTDKEFEFTFIFPDYTEVYMQDAPYIKYIWLDGKVEPLTDELAISIAQGGHKFIPAPNESRFWMIAAGLIMIVIALAGKRRKYYKNKNNKGSQ
ncbi:hypothetical protein FACS18942_06850 [Planctomycetales bacterium]|nr:hypothetical protein FACS18942_06850 [Planctomycetales bacterium]